MLHDTMKSLRSKKSSQKGFTLMEMLIVVAIIAILVAIAIPTFTSSLNKAKVAADKANLRAAYAEAAADYMDDNKLGDEWGTGVTEGTLKVTATVDSTSGKITVTATGQQYTGSNKVTTYDGSSFN